jgi:Tfp pilus assembly protein PilX
MRLQELKQRRAQRGAAVFIVVMVLSLITAIGVFSMRSASLVDLASGYNRQSVQASFVAEYAARAAATYLETNPKLAISTTRVPGCASALQTADINAPCNVIKMSLLATTMAPGTGTAPRAFADNLPGLLSLPADPTPIQAEFVTELTEPGPASAKASPGFVSGQFKEITLNSIARVYPLDGATPDVCSAGSRGAVSQQILRAHAIVP